MNTNRPDNFKLPGGEKTFGEIKEQYGEEFATKAFDAMERIQAGDGDFGELMDLYFDFCAKESGNDHIVLGPEPKVYAGKPEQEPVRVKPLVKGQG
jgi:hypothetical protein